MDGTALPPPPGTVNLAGVSVAVTHPKLPWPQALFPPETPAVSEGPSLGSCDWLLPSAGESLHRVGTHGTWWASTSLVATHAALLPRFCHRNHGSANGDSPHWLCSAITGLRGLRQL